MITLATVKTMLGLVATTYDTQISFFIPIIESDVRRILNHKFDEKVYCSFDSGSTTISSLYSYKNDDSWYSLLNATKLDHDIVVGRVIYHPNIPDGAYITAYDDDSGIATISQATTGAGEYIRTSILISQWQAMARMIWFRINKSTISTAVDATITSKSIGDVSVSFDVTQINKTYGYPQSIIDDLGTPYQRIG